MAHLGHGWVGSSPGGMGQEAAGQAGVGAATVGASGGSAKGQDGPLAPRLSPGIHERSQPL